LNILNFNFLISKKLQTIKLFLKKIRVHYIKNIVFKSYNFFFGYLFSYCLFFFIKIFYPNDRIVTNILFGNPGHIVNEFDQLFIKLSKLKKKIKIIIINGKQPNDEIFFKIFKDNFRFIIKNKLIYKYINLISKNYSKPFLNSTISNVRYHYEPLSNARSIKETMKLINKYYLLKSKCKESSLYGKFYKNDNLENFFRINKIEKKKYAVISIKQQVGNGSPLETNVATYLETIKFLNSRNFKVIFVGREKMPKIFYDYKVINYSNSTFINFHNDLSIFANSSFALTYASGISCIPDHFHIPHVHCGSWILTVPTFSKTTVFLPSVLNYKNGRILKFKDQYDIFYKIGQQPFLLENHNIVPQHPSSNEILESTKQALGLFKLDSTYYKMKNIFKNQFGKEPIYFSENEISNIFMKNNLNRF
jgi:putative glycosyltransferase (TIGR04372 family)